MIAEKLLDDLREQKVEADRRYHELAAQVAAGDSVDNGTALAILAAAGRTPDELDREVRRLARIAEIEPKIRELETLQQQSVEAEIGHGNRLDELRRTRDEAIEAVALAAAEATARAWERQNRGQELGDLQQELRGLQS